MKAFSIAFKDLTQSLRSMFLIGMAVIVPIALTGLMFIAFGGASTEAPDFPDLNLGIVNLDQPVDEQFKLGELISSMLTDESVSSWLNTSFFTEEAAARQALDERKLGAVIIIPANFSQNVAESGASAQITIVQDPTLTITPGIIVNMIQSFMDGIYGGGVAFEIVSEKVPSVPEEVSPALIGIYSRFGDWYRDFQRNLFHNPDAPLVLRAPTATTGPNQSGMANILSMIMVGQMIFFAFYTGAFAMMSILKENEEGTLARLFTTPTSRTVILAGKFISVLATVFLQAIVLIIVGALLFKVNWGSPLHALGATLAQVMAATGLGVFIIALVKNSRQAGPVLGGGLTVLGMLGGLFSVAIKMPEGFAAMAKFTPQGWVLSAWQASIQGSSSDLALSVLVCTGLGLALFLAGAFFFNRRFA